MTKKILIVFVMLITLSMASFAADNAVDKSTEIVIFHTNDVHGNADSVYNSDGILTNIGYPILKSYIDNNSMSDLTLLLDAGDFLQGTSFSTIMRGSNIAQLVKAVGYDAIAAGNHDLDYGYQRLLELVDEYKLNVLSMNVLKDDKDLLTPYIIKEIKNLKVAIIGVSNPQTPTKTNPIGVEGLSFTGNKELYDNLNALIDDLKINRNVDVVIVLSHLGIIESDISNSIKLAENVKGINVIIDGHSHSDIDKLVIGNTCIASAGDALRYLGEVTVSVDKDGVCTVSQRLIPAADLTDVIPNAEISDMLSKMNESLKFELETIVCDSPIDFNGERSDIRRISTNLGRLIAHMLLDTADADIAIMNGGSIRASISAGSVTKGNLITALPYTNTIMKIEATGQEILDTLSEAVYIGAGSFPQFAGMTIEAQFSDDQTFYNINSISVNGEPLDLNHTYTLAVNDFMYAGGDVYYRFMDNKLLAEYSSLNDTLITYLPTAAIDAINAEDNFIIDKVEDKVELPVIVVEPEEVITITSPQTSDSYIIILLIAISIVTVLPILNYNKNIRNKKE